MAKEIWFDMDGTIADFYGVEGWLEYLANYDVTPYATAKPLLNFSTLARRLNALQRKGYTIGIISWSSKKSTEDFDRRVEDAKRKWLATHLPSVTFNFIEVTAYGVPKEVGRGGILFDDVEAIRTAWKKKNDNAFPPSEILRVLKELA